MGAAEPNETFNQSETGQEVSANDTQNPPPAKLSGMNIFPAIFNGLGIGLLLGMLLGLSISPVVSGVIATLSSLLAVLIGLNEKYLDPLKSIRIGAFGLFTVVGVLLGLYLRANDPFAPSLADKKSEYKALGFDDDEALKLVLGFIQSDTGQARRQATVLYSTTINTNDCDVLFYTSDDAPVEETVNTFISAGGAWKNFAVVMQKELPEQLLAKALISLKDCFCTLGSSTAVKLELSDEIKKLDKSSGLAAIERSLNAKGGAWKLLIEKMRERIPDENQRAIVYLSTIKSLKNEK